MLYAVGIFGALFVPGAVTLLKGRSGMFAIGLLLAGGLVWMIVALRLAKPDSYWARWFYDEHKVARGRERYPKAGAARAVHLVGAILMLAAPVAIGLAVAVS